jgi:hypothetical protein
MESVVVVIGAGRLVNLRRSRTNVERPDAAVTLGGPDNPANVRRRETDSPAGSEHDVVESALIGSGVVLAADFEARRIGEHAMDLFLGRSRVPVPAPPGRGRELQ